jgi:hypothetical protein
MIFVWVFGSAMRDPIEYSRLARPSSADSSHFPRVAPGVGGAVTAVLSFIVRYPR